MRTDLYMKLHTELGRLWFQCLQVHAHAIITRNNSIIIVIIIIIIIIMVIVMVIINCVKISDLF